MARTVREASLATRSARLRLAINTKPYWRVIEQGLHLGYRRRATGGTWIARRRDERGFYREAKLGLADDLQDGNGDGVLDFSQAQRAAPSGPYTVARAMADYLEDYRRRGGKAADSIASVARQNILGPLGDTEVGKLTTKRLADWHRAIAERPRRWRARNGAKPNLAVFDRKNPDAVRRRRATANRLLTYLKAALNQAWRAGLVASDDAWRRVKPFKSVDLPVIRYLSRAEITRLLNACPAAFRDLLHVALLTGCRYGELCRLKERPGPPRHPHRRGARARRTANGGPLTQRRPAASRRRAGLETGPNSSARCAKPAPKPASCPPSVSTSCGTLTPRSWPCGQCRWRSSPGSSVTPTPA
jgi:hypothetical protein